MNKSELLDWLTEEHRQFEALLDEIGAARMEQPGVAGYWSIKDIVAHLTGWEEHKNIPRIQAALRNEPEPAPPWPAHLQSDDEINAWIYEANQGRSVSDVLDDTRRVFRQVLAAVEDFPEDARFETIESGGREYYLVWLGDRRVQPGELFDHFRDDHEAEIRAWLARAEQ
jgi:hypothetical protein